MRKRVVLDTNVTISALFWEGYPRKTYELVKGGKIAMLYSKKIEEEFIRVLGYSKFGLTSSQILPLVNNLRKYAFFVNTRTTVKVINIDPTDNIFIECAIDGKANYIVSGDHHLLNLGNYKKIKIIRAKDFLMQEHHI